MTEVHTKRIRYKWAALIIGVAGVIVAFLMIEPLRDLADRIVTPLIAPTRYGPYQYSRPATNLGALTEAEALQFAANSFKQAGLSVDRYTLQEDDRARTGDRFMVRNASNDNRGTLFYLSNYDGRRLVARIHLEGNTVYCELVLPR